MLVRQQLKLADSQQLVVSTFLRGTWASVCVSYFFVPVETGAPPFEETTSLLYGTRQGMSNDAGPLLYNLRFTVGGKN